MIDRSKVPFREAEGDPRYPALLKWGEIDQRLRASIWNALFPYFSNIVDYNSRLGYHYKEPWSGILVREFIDRRHGFLNDYEIHTNETALINEWSNFFKKSDYVEVFDFVTFLLRDGTCPPALLSTLAEALDKPYSPYRVVGSPLTIIPVLSEEQEKTLRANLRSVFDSKFGGARTHLQSALNAFENEDHRAVVREAIHSVESAVRDFTGDPNAILSRALRKLTEENHVHAALATAFEKLYAYSSDEKGIRHALVFSENENVGLHEAVFFLSSCAAFVAYLAHKYTK